jgi:hypothetical protein
MSSASPIALGLLESISTSSSVRLRNNSVYAVVEPTAPTPITAILVFFEDDIDLQKTYCESKSIGFYPDIK